jgi:tRNA (guanine37-N1)-methyltransferase
VRIDILTLFPEMFLGPLTESILKRAQKAGLIEIHIHDIRKFSSGKHHQADDKPYGGGAGMVMMAEPIVKCLEKVIEEGRKVRKGRNGRKENQARPYRVYLSPQGERLTQPKVEKLAKKHKWLILLCGHYEGIDQRVIDGWIDEEISIGDYVLTGGELPAMVLIDTIARQIPGVLGKGESVEEESFSKSFDRKKEYPHFTRPEVFRSKRVPKVLLSGNHREISEWRRKKIR